MRVIQVVVQTPPPPPPGIPVDPNFLIEYLAPLVGAALVLTFGALVLRWFFRSPIGEAIAEGIRLRRRRRWGQGGDVTGEPERVVALEEAVTRLHGQMSELAERLDFAERMLAERRQRQLGAGQ